MTSTDVPNLEPALTDAAGVAKLLGVSRRHIQALDSSGRIPAPIKLGRCSRWSIEEIRRWSAAGGPSRVRWLAMEGCRE